MSATEREAVAVLLRALADLVEGNEIGDAFYGVDVSFFPHVAREIPVIMAGLPLPWKAGKNDRGWQHIDGKAPGFGVTIFAKSADVSTQTGVVETPVWELRPEIAALMESASGGGRSES